MQQTNGAEESKSQSKKEEALDIPPVFVNIPEAEIELLKKESAECKDKYLRLLADSENMRKRLQKEKQEYMQFAIEDLITDFIDPIDHMENALSYTEQMSDEIKNWALGFQMIANQFKDVLNRNGVVAFTSVGTPFDPHHHEAIEMVITEEHPPGTVISESMKGYKIGDRTIRPARVKVAKAPQNE